MPQLTLRRLLLAILLAGAPARATAAAMTPSDSVRRLEVAIVLFTRSFTRTLTRAEIERVHEEIAEFAAFYQRHGAGRLDLRLSLVQIDRRLEKADISEVAPDRYYLSREDVAGELAARGFAAGLDEVIALYAWSNSNPDRAVQAYGGGAVGPDGGFLGDAGFNSIAAFGRDPGTISQVLIHEFLHNLDDMFARSGMPDAFLNADEMSRNLPALLADRPGAFLPQFTDADMRAYAERERQGRESYPWALQLQYYRWMIERVPAEAWGRLRYGHAAPAPAAPRALYDAVYTSAANESVYVALLGSAPGRLQVHGTPLAARAWTHTDFDGSSVSTGAYVAAWAPVPAGASDTLTIAGPSVRLPVAVARQRVASVVTEPVVVRYVDWGERPEVLARVRIDRCCGDGPLLPDAAMTVDGRLDLDTLDIGAHRLTLRSSVPGYYVHPARTLLVLRRSWSIGNDGPITASLGSPVTLNAFALEDRGRSDVVVTATLGGREVLLAPRGDGRFSANVPGDLPAGLHWARIRGAVLGSDADAVTDSVAVYVRPAGWIRVPTEVIARDDGTAPLEVEVRGRLGDVVRGARLPLVAVAADAVTSLVERGASGVYAASVAVPPGVSRVVVTSLEGDFQRRIIGVSGATARRSHRRGESRGTPFAAGIRLTRTPTIDGDAGDWPTSRAPVVTIGPGACAPADSAGYRGAGDLSGTLRFAWDDSTLYVAGDLQDDSLTIGDAWESDRVSLVVDLSDDDTPLTYTAANPLPPTWQEDDHWVSWRPGADAVRRAGRNTVDSLPGVRYGRQPTATGWRFELAVPRAGLPGYVPFVGQVVGLQVFVTDGDGGPAPSELMWSACWPHGPDGLEWRFAELGRLVLVDAPPD
jgi:hypothetical protein